MKNKVEIVVGDIWIRKSGGGEAKAEVIDIRDGCVFIYNRDKITPLKEEVFLDKFRKEVWNIISDGSNKKPKKQIKKIEDIIVMDGVD